MDTVKLIIWDMDETFWKGTLSDGEVSPAARNISIVKQLTDRGIVNSICSQNDFKKVATARTFKILDLIMQKLGLNQLRLRMRFIIIL